MTVVLGLHVAAGVTGLLVAWPVLLAPKRRGLHTRLGRVYAGTLLVMCVTALVLAGTDPPRLAGLAGIAVATLAAGAAGVWFARRRPRIGQLGRRGWMVWHLNLMCGSVISFVTAFAVTMTDGHPLAWVVPTLVGSPLIARATSRQVRRASPSGRVPVPAGPPEVAR